MSLFNKIILGLALVLGLAILMTAPGMAVQPDEMLDDPALEARAREISQDIRCLVCQNQSIDDSNADLAKDLRIIVRERLVAGDSNQQVKDFLVARYGDYVLLTPPFDGETLLLWGGPFGLLVLGGVAVFFWYRGNRRETGMAEAGPGLSAEEKARLLTLMNDEADTEKADRS